MSRVPALARVYVTLIGLIYETEVTHVTHGKAVVGSRKPLVRRAPRMSMPVTAALIATSLGMGISLAANPAQANEPPANFTLVGAGFGHGVGMSQWGARSMAVAGMDAGSIVTYYYQGTSVAPVPDTMEISVNIEYRKALIEMQSEALDPSGGGLEVAVNGAVIQGTPADEFRFQRLNGQVEVVKITGGESTVIGVGPSATARPIGPTVVHVVNKGSDLSRPGSRFRYGYVEVTPYTSGGKTSLNAVNKLRLHEEYLYGIAEVPSSWPGAALQAQVLAARTYALAKINSGIRASCNCHLDDGNGPYSDQTFVGWSKQSGAQGENWVNAVNATHVSPEAGLAILYDGQPIKAFYSASNGGASQASADAWGGVLPYAVSVPDPYSLDPANPESSWTRTITQAQAAQAFGVAAVTSMAITERQVSGAVKRITATLPDGSTVVKSGTAILAALKLKSTYLKTIDGNEGVPLAVAALPAQPDQPAVAPIPANARTVTLTTADRADLPAGKPFTVSAKVSPAAKGLRVWLQQQVNSEWQTISKKKTKAKGKVTFTVKEAWPPATTQLYRVVSTLKAEIVGASPDLTLGVVPSVKPRQVSLLSLPTVSVKEGKKVLIKAKVRPAKEGLTVWRQVLVSGDVETGEWKTVQTKKTKKNGKVLFLIKKAKPAGAVYTYRLLVVDDRQAAGVSPIISLEVRG